MAVLLIGGLLMSVMVPNLSALGSRSLQSGARELVAAIDLARQRSVVTGVPHQLVIDLDGASYGLQWELGDDPQPDAPRAPDDLTFSSSDVDVDPALAFSLAPPARGERRFAPLPGTLGRFTLLPDDIDFGGVETPGGWVDFGDVTVRFERDGSSSYSKIVLANGAGREAHVEILPLADSVRIEYEDP